MNKKMGSIVIIGLLVIATGTMWVYGDRKIEKAKGNGVVLNEDDLNKEIKNIHKDVEINSNKDSKGSNVLEVKININSSTSKEELDEFTEISDKIAELDLSVLNYTGIMSLMKVDNKDKACIRTYTIIDSKFKLEDNMIEDDNYKNL